MSIQSVSHMGPFEEKFRHAKALMPGVLISLALALAALFISTNYGGPAMLYALLLGMALTSVVENNPASAGIAFASRTVLRIGVALLGARITVDHLATLGPGPIVMVIAGVCITIFSGWALASIAKVKWDLGILTGGAVAICGASAALAISAVLPKHEDSERYTVLTVVGVTTLSTVAMVIYPLISYLIGFSNVEAGIFIGGTIHDVAQVVGAGYMISDETGEYATFVKLMRVLMLVPVVVVLSLIMRGMQTQPGAKRPTILPLFLIAFVALVVINSMGWIPPAVVNSATEFSGLCLVVAIAALGMKTSLAKIVAVGWKPVALIVGETLVLMAFVILVLLFVL